MKTIIPIPKPLSYFLIGIFITTAVIVVVDVIKSTNNWKKELDKFKSLRINSKLYEITNLQRGDYEIKVKYNDTLLSFNLPIAYYVRIEHIISGDSLAKETNSGTFQIYRTTIAGISHICTIDIY